MASKSSDDLNGSPELGRALDAVKGKVAQALGSVDLASEFRLWTEAIEALDSTLALVSDRRLDTLSRLRSEGASYDSIARATGLHKQRIAQLVRQLERRSRDE